MPCSHGLTTNGPDYNELLWHMSFPEPMKHSGSTVFTNRPTANASTFSVSPCRFATFPSQEQGPDSKELRSAIGK
jgi:hypothetical protein